MAGPFPPAVGGLANNMALLFRSSLAERFHLVPFSIAKRRRHTFPNRPHWDSLPYLILHAVRFFALMIRVRPDVVYVKGTSDTGFLRDTVLMAVAKLFGRPVLCHLHGRPRGRLFAADGGWRTRIPRYGIKLADAVIVLSPGLEEAFTAMFPGTRFTVVPNVVDLNRFRPGDGRAPDAPLRVLTVGRLSREKGTWDLLDAAARLAASDTPFEFRLCGIGETSQEEEALKSRVRELDLDDRVRFLGVVRGDALSREYREAHVAFLPSHAEIFPNAVLEGMAAGLPVVTTNVPVIPEMFTEGVEGFRHDPGDVAGMAGSLLTLAADEPARARMGAAARRLAEERYGLETGARAIGDLMTSLIATGERRST